MGPPKWVLLDKQKYRFSFSRNERRRGELQSQWRKFPGQQRDSNAVPTVPVASYTLFIYLFFFLRQGLFKVLRQGSNDPPVSGSEAVRTIIMYHQSLLSDAYWKGSSLLVKTVLEYHFQKFQELVWEFSNKLSLISSYSSKCGSSESCSPTNLHMILTTP